MADAQLIDLHSHWLPADFVERLQQRASPPRILAGTPPRLQRKPDETPGFALGDHWFDLDRRLEHLQQHGIGHQLLCWPTTFGFEADLPVEEAKALWQDYNRQLAEVVARHPKRFSGLAVLSTADPQWSAQQLQKAHHSQGLIGAVLPVNAFASLASATYLQPILQQAQQLGSHLYLHTGFAHPQLPGQPLAQRHTDNQPIRGTLDTLGQFSAAVVTLLMSDLLDAYPDVSIQIAMLGGAGLFANLVEAVFRDRPEQLQQAPFKTRLQRLYFDTGAMGNGSAAIALHARVLGSQSIVFGSDYAPVADVAPVIARVRASGLSPADQDSLLHGRARQLLARHGIQL